MIKNFLKLNDMLTRGQRNKAFVLLLLMLIGMVLETLGIGLVLPILAVIADKDALLHYPRIQRFFVSNETLSHQDFVMIVLVILLVFYAIKTIFLFFLAWRQSCFAFEVQENFSQRLFNLYISQPWVFHLERNSAILIRNAIGEVNSLVATFIIPFLSLVVEVLVLAGIATLLIIIEPVGAIYVTLVLLVAAWLFNRVTGQRLAGWGKRLQVIEGARIQHLQQALGGAKEVKLLGRELDFISGYQICNIESAHLLQRQSFTQMLPRLWFEFLAIFGLVGLGLVVMKQGKSPSDLLTILGFFGAAAFRLLPSVSKIISSLQYIRYSEPILANLHQELQLPQVDLNKQTTDCFGIVEKIEVKSLRYRYPGSSNYSVSDISVVIPCGSSVGIIGGSGAGKSTLVDLILGLLKPEAGQITVDNVDIYENIRGWQNQIGYVPQYIYLTDDSLRRNVAFGIPESIIDDDAVWAALDVAQLKSFVSALPNGIDTVVGERGVKISGGQRQRIGIARALYHNPKVLVLDEATSALDTDTEDEIMKSVNSLHGQKTVLIVAHRLSTISNCDSVFVIENGALKKVATSAELLNG